MNDFLLSRRVECCEYLLRECLIHRGCFEAINHLASRSMVLRLRHEQICRPATLARSVAVKKKREGGYREEEYNPASHHYAL